MALQARFRVAACLRRLGEETPLALRNDWGGGQRRVQYTVMSAPRSVYRDVRGVREQPPSPIYRVGVQEVYGETRQAEYVVAVAWRPANFLRCVMLPFQFFEMPGTLVNTVHVDFHSVLVLGCLAQFLRELRSPGRNSFSPKFVALRYAKTWLILDVSIVTFDWVLISQNERGFTSRSGGRQRFSNLSERFAVSSVALRLSPLWIACKCSRPSFLCRRCR